MADNPVRSPSSPPPLPRLPAPGRIRLLMLVGLVLICAVAAGGGWWFRGKTVWTDGSGMKLPDAPEVIREIAWTPAKALSAINTADQEYEPSLSPDGTELYFVRGKAARNADIYVSYKRGDAWTEPTPLDGINTQYDDLGPRVTADNRFLLFYSNRPGGVGGYDVWAAPRTAGGWGTPFNLGPNINSEFDEYSPAPTPDSKRLFFATNRKAAAKEQKENWRATIRASENMDFDLWVAALDADASAAGLATTTRPATQPVAISVLSVGDDFATPGSAAAPSTRPTTAPARLIELPAPTTRPSSDLRALVYLPAAEVPGVNSTFTEGASCLSPAGDFLYFSSNRPGGYGKFDLYRCRIDGDKYGKVENLGPAINTADNETDPFLNLAGFRLYFSSDRPALAGAATSPDYHGYDLMQSESVEVYADRMARKVPTLGWSWWVLFGAILLLIPLAFFARRIDPRHLTILQICLIVSILIHVVGFSGMSFYNVILDIPRVAGELGITTVAVNLDQSAEIRQAEVGAAIRQQSSNDLPVTQAPPGALAQSSVGAELPGPIQGMQVNVPQAGGGAEPLVIQVQGPKIELPQAPVKPIEVAPLVAPQPDLIDIKVAAAPRIARPEAAIPSAEIVQSQAAKIALPDVPMVTPNVTVQAPKPTVTAGASLAEVTGAIRAPVPEIRPPDVTPQLPTGASAAPTVEGPKPQIARVTGQEAVATVTPDVVNAPSRQGTKVDAPTAAAVKTDLPAVTQAKTSPADSMAAEAATPRDPGAGAAALARVTGTSVDPTVSNPIAGPTVSSPRPVGGPIARSGPDAPTVTESTAGVERAGPVAGTTGAKAVESSVPAAAQQTTPQESIAGGAGVGARTNPAATALASAGVQGPNLPTDITAAPDVRGPNAASVRVSSGQPDAPQVSEVAGGVGRQSPGAAPSGAAAASVDTKVPTAGAGSAGESLAAATPGPANNAAAAISAAIQGGKTPQVTPGSATPSPLGGVDVSIKAGGARQQSTEASPLAGVIDPGATSSAKTDTGTAAAMSSGTKDVSIGSKPIGAAGAGGSIASLSGPTTRPSAIASAMPLAGPTVGPVSGAVAAQSAGIPTIDGPKIATAAPVAGGTTETPKGGEPVAGVTKSENGSNLTGASGPALTGGTQTSVPTASAAGTESLASAASNGIRTNLSGQAISAPPVAFSGTGLGVGPSGIEGPQIGLLPKMASAPVQGTGQGSPSGTGSTPGGGPEGGPLASAKSAIPGDGVGAGRAAMLATITLPGAGTAAGIGPGGSGGTGPAAAIGRRIGDGDVPLVRPEITLIQPKVAAPEALFQRSVERRRPLVEKNGGTPESEKAVDRGLAYLARMQEEDGSWTLIQDDRKPAKKQKQQHAHDMAFTGLPILAFLAADHVPNREGPYRETVSKALEFLLDGQAKDGDLRGPKQFHGSNSGMANMYDHAVATMALAEAALMTGDKRYQEAAFKGADFILAAQNRKTGGWRYTPGDPGDMSVFGWQILALHDCEQLGYVFPEDRKLLAVEFLESCTNHKNRIFSGYQPGRGYDPVMTAEGLFCRMLLDLPVSDEAVREASQYITQQGKGGGTDLYFWYYASLSLSQMQNDAWRDWNAKTRDTLIKQQIKGGASDGAWIEDRYIGRVGRVYTTALATLTLEVYYRYLPFNPDNAGKGNAGQIEKPKIPATGGASTGKKKKPMLEPN